MDVSENSGTPQIIHFNEVFPYKPSILGNPYFLETPKWESLIMEAILSHKHGWIILIVLSL